MTELRIGAPNEKQRRFLLDRHRHIAYGGARGGGKSWAVRTKAKLLALRYAGIKLLIVRRTLRELQNNHIDPLRQELAGKLSAMEKQLTIFSKQKLFFHLRRQKQELVRFRSCDRKARDLVCHMEALCLLEHPGRLTEENRRRLEAAGAEIRDRRPLDSVMEVDVVTNYHVGQILTLRQALLQELGTQS